MAEHESGRLCSDVEPQPWAKISDSRNHKPCARNRRLRAGKHLGFTVQRHPLRARYEPCADGITPETINIALLTEIYPSGGLFLIGDIFYCGMKLHDSSGFIPFSRRKFKRLCLSSRVLRLPRYSRLAISGSS